MAAGTNFQVADTSTLTGEFTNAAGLITKAFCTGTPPTTASKFIHGAIITQTDTATGARANFENTGSTASPVWSLMSVGASSIALAATTAAYAGGGTSNAFTATGLLATDIVSAVIRTSTNAVAIAKAIPTANTLTVTFTADPGATTTVDYIAVRATA